MNNTPQPLLPKRSAGRGKGSGVEENPQRGDSLIDDVIPLGGYTFVAAHNHPVLDCDPMDFEDYRLRLPASLQWGVDVNEATIERDDTWPIANLGVPEGRVYVHQNTVTFSGEFLEESRFEESHTAILDGGAVFFFPCR